MERPNQIWLARWNYTQTTAYQSARPEFKDSYWANHQRMKQYWGDHTETWGGVGIAIDSTWADAVLPGNPTQTVYGPAATGPGGAGFVFTGDMRYWKALPGVGLAARAFSTGTSGTAAEANGATWSSVLAPGT